MLNKSLFLVLILFQFYKLKSQAQEQIVIGTKYQIQSEILHETREYWVSLPESYHEAGNSYKQFPVVILLDGNIHFRSITGMVHYMSSGANGNYQIPEMIIVGIQNVDRRQDFTPDKIITIRENNSGGGDSFLRFLEEELIPELDKNYRTEPYRVLAGHSLGGLLATHAFMKDQSLFKAFIAIDPSFGTWDSETMDKKLEVISPNAFDRYLYLATANWGKRNIRNRDRHVRLYESLNSKYEGTLRGKLDYFENEDHGSVPIIAFYEGINALFEGYGISFREVDSIEQLNVHFQEISNRISWNIPPPEALVNRIGYRFLQSRNESEKARALDFFILNTKNFPKSSNAFDSLGETYELLGEREKAIANYQKSWSLNPANEHAQAKVKELQNQWPEKK